MNLFRSFSTVLAPGLDPALLSERNGPVLSKEPILRVLATFLANNVGFRLGWKLAGRISSVAENVARLSIAGDGSLIRINEFLD